MTPTRLSEDRGRGAVSDPAPTTVVQVVDQRPRVVIEQTGAQIISVGTQGPPGPTMAVPGTPGDVLFNGNTALAADSGEFFYSLATRALNVRTISGTTLDGGNF